MKADAGWEKVSEEVALAVAKSTPEVLVGSRTGVWEVVLLCKLGETPHRLVLSVDPYSGKMIDRQALER